MTPHGVRVSRKVKAGAAIGSLAGVAVFVPVPANADADVALRFYGFAQVDYIQDFNRVDPA